MLKASLTEQSSGQELYIANQNGYKVLVSETHAQVAGLFKAETLNAPGTVIVTEPDPDGCIVLTDIILTSDKTLNSVITIQFTDGTNTIPIIVADMAEAPVSIATSFGGRWQGWRNAQLELVIVGGVNPTATLAAGYYKLHDSLLYDEWDSLR